MVTAHAIGHLARRGLEAAQDHLGRNIDPAYIAKLQQDAQLYEKSGKEVNPLTFLPIVITAIIAILLIASIRYTVGDVMASLAMIESPSATAIIEPKSPPKYSDEAPPAYADEPDAPFEKEALIDEEARETDVEVTVINHKPITAKIVTTIGHLHRVGGFRARWRGLGLSILYHGLHSVISNFLANMMGFGVLGHLFAYTATSLGVARLHMVWTHSMIAHPSAKPFWKRIVPRKQCKALLLPTLVYSLAQQATFILPIGVAFAMGLPEVRREHLEGAMNHENCHKMVLMGLRFLAVPATALFVALAVLLPAAVTLTRIEALLLPEEEETIVPFDKAGLLRDGEIDLSARGASRAVFVQAWRSFDRSARLRLVKLYVKMVLAQFTIAMIGLHLVVAELYLLGPERLTVFFKSAAAQIKLGAIENMHPEMDMDVTSSVGPL